MLANDLKQLGMAQKTNHVLTVLPVSLVAEQVVRVGRGGGTGWW